MNKANLFNFLVDKENQQINVERSFDAPLDLVWSAWTEAEILDQWWAPKPWKAVTKSMNFNEDGYWFYAMTGPDGEKQWCRFDFNHIRPQQHFSGIDAFCNENAVVDETMPRIQWSNDFIARDEDTVVHIQLKFNSLRDLETIIQMGFKEGFMAGLENLDHYIAAQFYLRKQNKPDNKSRVCTYLNFPGNTEEAFTFYKSVFRSEFINGIQRFGELPPEPGQPPVADNVKNMVLHVELPILGGYSLMGTDAPKEFGFNITQGNKMHIHLEPDNREEADRIFNELSEGGKIEMPMQDMFWGAYYGSFKDKFGINWMVNYQMK